MRTGRQRCTQQLLGARIGDGHSQLPVQSHHARGHVLEHRSRATARRLERRLAGFHITCHALERFDHGDKFRRHAGIKRRQAVAPAHRHGGRAQRPNRFGQRLRRHSGQHSRGDEAHESSEQQSEQESFLATPDVANVHQPRRSKDGPGDPRTGEPPVTHPRGLPADHGVHGRFQLVAQRDLTIDRWLHEPIDEAQLGEHRRTGLLQYAAVVPQEIGIEPTGQPRKPLPQIVGRHVAELPCSPHRVTQSLLDQEISALCRIRSKASDTPSGIHESGQDKETSQNDCQPAAVGAQPNQLPEPGGHCETPGQGFAYQPEQADQQRVPEQNERPPHKRLLDTAQRHADVEVVTDSPGSSENLHASHRPPSTLPGHSVRSTELGQRVPQRHLVRGVQAPLSPEESPHAHRLDQSGAGTDPDSHDQTVRKRDLGHVHPRRLDHPIDERHHGVAGAGGQRPQQRRLEVQPRQLQPRQLLSVGPPRGEHRRIVVLAQGRTAPSRVERGSRSRYLPGNQAVGEAVQHADRQGVPLPHPIRISLGQEQATLHHSAPREQRRRRSGDDRGRCHHAHARCREDRHEDGGQPYERVPGRPAGHRMPDQQAENGGARRPQPGGPRRPGRRQRLAPPSDQQGGGQEHDRTGNSQGRLPSEPETETDSAGGRRDSPGEERHRVGSNQHQERGHHDPGRSTRQAAAGQRHEDYHRDSGADQQAASRRRDGSQHFEEIRSGGEQLPELEPIARRSEDEQHRGANQPEPATHGSGTQRQQH